MFTHVWRGASAGTRVQCHSNRFRDVLEVNVILRLSVEILSKSVPTFITLRALQWDEEDCLRDSDLGNTDYLEPSCTQSYICHAFCHCIAQASRLRHVAQGNILT